MGEHQSANLWEMSDLCTPWCVYVAATLRIAEHMAAGKGQIGELATAAGCDEYALHRVLTYLAGKGVFEETEPGRFALNDAARGFLEPMMRLGLDLNGFGGRMAYSWSTMLKYVQSGSPAYIDVFGQPFWEDLNAHPELHAQFDDLMGPPGHGTPSVDFEITGGWEKIRSVVDVGGGTGAMLAEILKKWPHIHGTLVDFPQTVARATEIFKAAGVDGRVETVGQSFFDSLPPGADLYLLKKVINDWPDKEAVAILRRCAEAARPAGRVLVPDAARPDGEPAGISIEMVLAGGKHRTVTEFKEIVRKAGLELTAAGRQSSGRIVFECRPGKT